MSKLVLPDGIKPQPQDPAETTPATPPAPAPEPVAQPQAPEAAAPATGELPPPLAEAVESQPIIPEPAPPLQPGPAPEPTKPKASPKAVLSGLLLAGVALVGIIAALNGRGVNNGSGPAPANGNPGGNPAAGNIPKGLV